LACLVSGGGGDVVVGPGQLVGMSWRSPLLPSLGIIGKVGEEGHGDRSFNDVLVSGDDKFQKYMIFKKIKTISHFFKKNQKYTLAVA
jgi:hypothetical protein